MKVMLGIGRLELNNINILKQVNINRIFEWFELLHGRGAGPSLNI